MKKDKEPLSITHPEIAKEADGWDPKNVSAGSDKKLEWKCKKNHIWIATVANRSNGRGCPVCSNKKVQIGENDLATTHPEIAKEAFGWDPRMVVAGSNKKLEWKCKKNHIWSSSIYNRVNTKSCPVCSNRTLLIGTNDLATTHPEIAKEAFGWDPKTVIAGTNKKLIWKCHKGHTWKATGNDRIHGNTCGVCSNRILQRGSNDLVTTHPELAKEAFGWDPTNVITGTNRVLVWKCQKGHTWSTGVNARIRGKGCPVCSNKKVQIGENDLATTHPEIAKEAFGWDPKTVIAGTAKKLQWKCPKGHLWLGTGDKRKVGAGCPYCANYKLLTGFNDLATTHPEIAKEAFGWDPKTVIAGTAKKLQWKCSYGHKWIATGHDRASNKGCPSCAKTGFDPNKKGYIYFLINSKWEIYQVGITNSPRNRLGRHKRNGFDVLDLRGPIDGYAAREIETSILRFLKSQKADLSPEHIAGKFDGYSESWTIDSFKVNNLKELIDKATDAGF